MSRVLMAKISHKKLYNKLIKENNISKGQFRVALKQVAKNKRPLTDAIIGLVNDNNENAVLSALSEHHDLPVVWLRTKVITPNVLKLIPKTWLRNTR